MRFGHDRELDRRLGAVAVGASDQRALLAASAALLLASCSREEEPVANRFERQAAEIQNKVENRGEAEDEPAQNAAD